MPRLYVVLATTKRRTFSPLDAACSRRGPLAPGFSVTYMGLKLGPKALSQVWVVQAVAKVDLCNHLKKLLHNLPPIVIVLNCYIIW